MADRYPDKRVKNEQTVLPDINPELPDVSGAAVLGRADTPVIDNSLPEVADAQKVQSSEVSPQIPPDLPETASSARQQAISANSDLPPELPAVSGQMRQGVHDTQSIDPSLPEVAEVRSLQVPQTSGNIDPSLPEVYNPARQSPRSIVNIDPSLPETADGTRIVPLPVSADIQPNLPEVSAQRVIVPAPVPQILNPNLPETGDARDQRFQTAFDGAWIPDGSGINVGPKNYQTLRNLRYRPDGLEGTDGTSYINTNATGKYLKNGIQLLTNYSQRSYILAQGEDSDGTDKILVKNTQTVPTATDFDGVVTVTLPIPFFLRFYRVYDGTETSGIIQITIDADTYTGATLASHIQTRMNAHTTLTYNGLMSYAVAYSGTTFTITATGGTVAYVDSGSTGGDIIGFTANQGPSASISSDTAATYSTAFFTEDASASRGRFSKLPQGHIGFCDQKANKIWAGDEMPVGGFFLIDRTLTNTFFEEWIQDYTERVNNSLSDSGNVVVVDAITKTFGDATSRFDVTASTTTNGNFRYTYDGTGTAPLFVTNGLEIGHVVVIPAGATGFAAANIGNLKVTAVAETYFEAENPSGSVESNIVLGYATGMTSKGKAILVGTTRQATAFKFDLSSVNTTAGVVTTYGWDGDEFLAMTNSDGTASPAGTTMGQDGTITLTSNTSSIVPALIGGRYLYWYMFTFVTMTATIQQITAQCNFQNVSDLWDGIWRLPIHCGKYVLSTTTSTDYSLEVVKESYKSHSSDATVTYVINAKSMVAKNDYLELMFEEPICALQIKIYSPNDGSDSTAQIYTNTGSNWEAADMIQDSTNSLTNPPGWEYIGGTSLYKDGIIQWQIPSVENKVTIQGKTGYAYRIYFDVATGSSTEIDTIKGMPSYRVLTKNYVFPHMHRNRALWCGCVSDGEKNRIDYSSKYRPDVYNGTDASGRFNERSLYFGSKEPLTGAVELFNQFADGLDSVSIFTKATETFILTGDAPADFAVRTLSRSIGCPAPLTLDTAEVAVGASGAARQNVALWMDANVGPVMSNGGTIQPIVDYNIKRYWTPGSDYAIPAEYVGICAGIYDPNFNEYHLVIPSGSTATTNNTWLIYDLARGKWRENYIGASADFPQAFLRVEDTYGNKYIYALTNTGYMIRLDSGRTWSDGTAITYTVKTGDALFSQSMWDETMVRLIKVMFDTNTAGYLTVNHYLNGNATRSSTVGSATAGLPPTATPRTMAYSGYNYRNLILQCAATDGESTPKYYDLRGLSHAFEFIVTNCSETKPKLLGWAAMFTPTREDTLDKDGY